MMKQSSKCDKKKQDAVLKRKPRRLAENGRDKKKK